MGQGQQPVAAAVFLLQPGLHLRRPGRVLEVEAHRVQVGVLPEAAELADIHPDAGAVGAVVIEDPGDPELLRPRRGGQGDGVPFLQMKGLGQRLGNDYEGFWVCGLGFPVKR